MKMWLPLALVPAFLPGILLAEDSDREQVRRALESTIPDMEVGSVRESKIDGLYEVTFGADLVYVTADGRYLLRGDLLDLEQHRNLSEDRRAAMRRVAFGEVPTSEIIEFAPRNPKHVLYVFTDTDCSYCRRLHQQVPELNRRGIAIRYLAYPRAGVDSGTFREMESVWCSPDRNSALTEAKLGRTIRAGKCANPVERQMHLGEQIGVRGTPAIYLQNGVALGGYMSVEELVEEIGDD